MGRKGFVLFIIIAIAAVAIVAGAIGYLEWKNSAAPQTAPLLGSTSSPPSGTTATTTPLFNPSSNNSLGGASTTAAAQTNNCGVDIGCFVAAAKTCTPTVLNVENSQGIFGPDSIDNTVQARFSLGGLTDGNCSFSSVVTNVTLSIPSSTEQFMKSEGLTDAQIQQRLQELQASDTLYKQAVSSTLACSVPTADLARAMQDLKNGVNMTKDLGVGKCAMTDASGAKMSPGVPMMEAIIPLIGKSPTSTLPTTY